MKLAFYRRLFFGIVLVLSSTGIAKSSQLQASEEIWQSLHRGEAVALIRHAIAPGTGDPPGFRLGDCSTQRNLSHEGRVQSGRIGEFFRAQGIQEASVYSSQWCRCLETARLLRLGPVSELPALNSFFTDRAKGPEQTREIRAFISESRGKGPHILVTHQVNITALTGVFPSSGEIVIFQIRENGQGEILGRFTAPSHTSP